MQILLGKTFSLLWINPQFRRRFSITKEKTFSGKIIPV
jgi:hypothetical protein